MLLNIESTENLRSLYSIKSLSYETKSILYSQLEEYKEKGWEMLKKNNKSVRIRQNKTHETLLEDRVWVLFYKMRFQFISNSGGGSLVVNSRDHTSSKTNIDVVAIDNEIVLAFKCKSSLNFANRPKFQEELSEFALLRENLIKTVRTQYPTEHKKQCVLAMFTSKINLSDKDIESAKNANIIILDEHDLSYYENLINHLGPAAKYQILADMIPGKEIPGLSIRIPAIKTKIGGNTCYNFCISPEYLLKISYVSHRSKGKASDINTYQRMLSKTRLNKIKDYIKNDGVFPTNIVINIDKGKLRFDKIKQESEAGDLNVGTLGWLDIKPTYKAAWIIDGQHRLFSYSGLEDVKLSKLTVTAFEGLKPSKQAELFIDINAKQKSVKQSLLQELYAELHWDADEPEVRVRAIISKSIQDLNLDPSSPLFSKIQTNDLKKDSIRCITLTSLFGQIEKRGFHIIKEKNGSILEYGPLWANDNNELTLKRTIYIIKNWLLIIVGKNREWWDKGSDVGGGLAMNDGVSACLSVLRSVFEFLEKRGKKLVLLENKDLFDVIKPYGEALGNYFNKFDESQRKSFRDLRGIQGITTRLRMSQAGIRIEIPTFSPEGLNEWIELQKSETNKKAKLIIDEIEVRLQGFVLDTIKREFGKEENEWWVLGIPKPVRQKVSQRWEDEDGKRGGKEHYFDLIDYRKIIIENWGLFESSLGFEKGSKDKKTDWLNFINERRKIVSHASSGVTIKTEELTQLESYYEWILAQIGKFQDTEEK